MARLVARLTHQKRDSEHDPWRNRTIVADVSFDVDPALERSAARGSKDAMREILGHARLMAFAEAARIVAEE